MPTFFFLMLRLRWPHTNCPPQKKYRFTGNQHIFICPSVYSLPTKTDTLLYLPHVCKATKTKVPMSKGQNEQQPLGKYHSGVCALCDIKKDIFLLQVPAYTKVGFFNPPQKCQSSLFLKPKTNYIYIQNKSC